MCALVNNLCACEIFGLSSALTALEVNPFKRPDLYLKEDQSPVVTLAILLLFMFCSSLLYCQRLADVSE